jgi:hypothetical protein
MGRTVAVANNSAARYSTTRTCSRLFDQAFGANDEIHESEFQYLSLHLPKMKPTLTVILGFAFVLVPFWAQFGGFQFPALVFSLSYLIG